MKFSSGQSCALFDNSSSKYSYQLKIHAVQEYLSKECSYAEVCRKFDIHSKRQLITWVHEQIAIDTVDRLNTTLKHLRHLVGFRPLSEEICDCSEFSCGKMRVGHLWCPFFCLEVFKSLPQMAFLFF